MLSCTQVGQFLPDTTKEQQSMKTFNIDKDTAVLIRDGAAKTKTATGAKKKAAEALAASGARGYYFTKEGVKDEFITKETFVGIQGLIASGLLSKAEFALWAMDSKAAKAAGKQDERNALTSAVNAYLASFRGMIETAWARLFPEEAKAEKDAAEAEAAAKAAEKSEGGQVTGESEGGQVTSADLRRRMLDLITDVAAFKVLRLTPRRAKEEHDTVLKLLNEVELIIGYW